MEGLVLEIFVFVVVFVEIMMGNGCDGVVDFVWILKVVRVVFDVDVFV